MTTKSSTDPVTRLAELEHVRDEARQAEADARDEHAVRLRAIPLARATLQAAHATGEGIPAAEKAFSEARTAAADPALGARADGLAQRSRAADVVVQQHLTMYFSELVEAMRPRAEEVVAAVTERALALRSALDEWNHVAGDVGRLGRTQQWFIPHARIPADPFDRLRSALDQLATGIPMPMPDTTINPVEQAERDRAERDRAAAERDR